MATDTNPISDEKTFSRALADFLASPMISLGGKIITWFEEMGLFARFFLQVCRWLFTRLPYSETILTNFFQVGWRSLPVVALTGTFIGMVLVAQSYIHYEALGIASRLGAVIDMSLVRELGPILAAIMLAGRVGSAIAAELGTMRVTEQIDALSSMGVNPIHYLVVPRVLACILLIPILTIIADFMGIAGAYVYSVYGFGINAHHYALHAREFVSGFDLFTGVFKSLFFGAAIALIACHRGFTCDPGAEGVGRAATISFVQTFVAILLLDFFLGIALNGIQAEFFIPAKMMM